MKAEAAKVIAPSSQGSPRLRAMLGNRGTSRPPGSEEGMKRRVAVEDEEEENDRIVLDSFFHWEAEEGGSINFQHMLQQVDHSIG